MKIKAIWKKYKGVIILGMTLVVLAGAYFVGMYIRSGSTVPIDSSNTTNKSIDMFLVNDVSKFQIYNSIENKTYDFEKNTSGQTTTWVYTEKPTLQVDQDTFTAVIRSMSYITFDSVVTDDLSRAGEFGLKNPSVFTATLANGDVKKFEIGSSTPTHTGYYCMSSDSSVIFTVSASVGDSMLITEGDLYNKTIFDFTIDDLKQVIYNKATSSILDVYYDGKTYYTRAPIYGFQLKDQEFTDFRNELPLLKKSTYVGPASDKAKYGLDNPSYKLRIVTDTMDKTLILGTEIVKNSEIYAMIEGQDDIFVFDLSTFPSKDVDIMQLIVPSISLPFLRDQTAININLQGTIITTKQELNDNDPTTDKFFVNGINVSGKNSSDQLYYKEFYYHLVSLEAVKLDVAAKPTGPKEVTIEFVNKDGSKTLIECIKKDDNYAYAFLNGKYTGTLIDRAKYKEILDSYNDMMTNGKV
jgi:hypothetical protein